MILVNDLTIRKGDTLTGAHLGAAVVGAGVGADGQMDGRTEDTGAGAGEH